MQKRTREIVALALLGILLVIGVSAMGYYILVGHNWNVAASKIDDSIGQMDGYTVVLYEGTQPLTCEDDEDADSSRRTHANLDEVAADYRSKGANVFKVKAADLLRPRAPYLMSRDDKRLGFFNVGNAERRSQIRSDIAYLRSSSADYVIALSSDATLGELASEEIITGLSVIIYTAPEGEVENGEYRGSAYCVCTPEAGEVGAVIISPSGVCSTKTFGRS